MALLHLTANWLTTDSPQKTGIGVQMAGHSKVASKTSKKSSTGKTFCVVCPTWEIKNPDRCSNTIKKASKTLYFCTKRCKERYQKAPEKFT